jgi:Mn2+/Fe2+ NRAMP family transporter
VALSANLVAMLFQALSAKIGIAAGRSLRSSPSATSTLSRRCRIEIAVELGLQEQGPCDLQSRLS